MKRSLLIIGVAFAITLAVIFSSRVSTDALGVVIGVILGILAGVPTTVVVMFVMLRSRNELERNGSSHPQQPSIVVVGGHNPQPVYSPPVLPTLPSPTKRTFTVVGDDDTEA